MITLGISASLTDILGAEMGKCLAGRKRDHAPFPSKIVSHSNIDERAYFFWRRAGELRGGEIELRGAKQ